MVGGAGLYMGRHLCSPLCVYVKAMKEYRRKGDFSAAYHNKRDARKAYPEPHELCLSSFSRFS